MLKNKKSSYSTRNHFKPNFHNLFQQSFNQSQIKIFSLCQNFIYSGAKNFLKQNRLKSTKHLKYSYKKCSILEKGYFTSYIRPQFQNFIILILPKIWIFFEEFVFYAGERPRNSFTTKAVGSADKATQGDAKFCIMNFRNILGTFQPKNP